MVFLIFHLIPVHWPVFYLEVILGAINLEFCLMVGSPAESAPPKFTKTLLPLVPILQEDFFYNERSKPLHPGSAIEFPIAGEVGEDCESIWIGLHMRRQWVMVMEEDSAGDQRCRSRLGKALWRQI